MRGLEGIGNLARDRQRLIERQRPLCDPVGQRRALDELHDERADRQAGNRRRVALLETVRVCDVGVIERGKDLCFALEPRETIGLARQRVGEYFRARRGRVPCDARATPAPCRPRR